MFFSCVVDIIAMFSTNDTTSNNTLYAINIITHVDRAIVVGLWSTTYDILPIKNIAPAIRNNHTTFLNNQSDHILLDTIHLDLAIYNHTVVSMIDKNNTKINAITENSKPYN